MSLSTQIEQDYIAAYKAKDSLRLGVLRLLKTAAKNLQVELMRPITDEELAAVIQKQAKQRQDSIEQYSAANRPDLAAREADELAILKGYLPEPLSAAELDAAPSRPPWPNLAWPTCPAWARSSGPSWTATRDAWTARP